MSNDGTEPRPEAPRVQPAPRSRASLAFVIHLREPVGDAEQLEGRVEHVTSGREARFRCGADLLALLRGMAGTVEPQQ